MTPVLTRHAPERVDLRRVVVPIALAVCFIALLTGVLRLVEDPATVDHLVIENRTGAAVDVGIASDPQESEILLATIEPDSSTRVDDVLDQGSTWEFRVAQAGERIGTVTRSRDRLERDGWRVVLPASLGEPSEP